MNDESYIQPELGVSAFLVARGCTYKGLHSLGGNRYAFRFEDDGHCAQIAQDYWRDEPCPGSKLIAALRYLKNELSNAKTMNHRGSYDGNTNPNAHHRGPAYRK